MGKEAMWDGRASDQPWHGQVGKVLGSEHTGSLDLDFLGCGKGWDFCGDRADPCLCVQLLEPGRPHRAHVRVCVWGAGVGGRQGWGPVY